MNSDESIQQRLQQALRGRIPRPTDKRGYVRTPAENLVDGVSLDQFEDDLRSGDGDELRMKFCAAYSSAALVVNSFAWFKASDRMGQLDLLAEKGAESLMFERRFRIFRGGTPPHLDVWIERKYDNIAIESKLTEYFTKTRAEFSQAYDRLAPPDKAEYCWWMVYKQAKESEPRYLDVGQLVKHYFGLWKYKQRTRSTKKIVLLYLFWEPLNWQDIHACREHRKELEQLVNDVQESKIVFEAMPYSRLWEAWSGVPELEQHAANLKARYEVRR